MAGTARSIRGACDYSSTSIRGARYTCWRSPGKFRKIWKHTLIRGPSKKQTERTRYGHREIDTADGDRYSGTGPARSAVVVAGGVRRVFSFAIFSTRTSPRPKRNEEVEFYTGRHCRSGRTAQRRCRTLPGVKLLFNRFFSTYPQKSNRFGVFARRYVFTSRSFCQIKFFIHIRSILG